MNIDRESIEVMTLKGSASTEMTMDAKNSEEIKKILSFMLSFVFLK